VPHPIPPAHDPGRNPFPRGPQPGGSIPGETPPTPEPDEQSIPGPFGPRTPYPVDDPPMDPAGSEPDYLPGVPTDPGIRL
jgi:hypothetical protein